MSTNSVSRGRPFVAVARGPILGLAVLLAAPVLASADALDRDLLRHARELLPTLKAQGYRNIGVLKFRVKRGTEAVSDRVGPMNLDLASRLELALALADDLKDPVGIIRNASAVAAKLPGANHLTAAGRSVLLDASYPLAWGGKAVRPDVLLTGVAALSPDLRKVSVSIQAFGRGRSTLEQAAYFEASTDPATLAKAGVDFLAAPNVGMRGGDRARAGDGPAGLRISSSRQPNPLEDKAAPVVLDIFYDGQPIPIGFRDGGAWIPEPVQGQSVVLVLRKAANDSERYGVVLLVNGLNTLYKERLEPLNSRKWILSDRYPRMEVSGYQVSTTRAEAFLVIAPEEVRRNTIHYGPEPGMIALYVFAERRGRPAPAPAPLDQAAPPADPTAPKPLEPMVIPAQAPEAAEEEADLKAMTRGSLPMRSPATLGKLKRELLGAGGTASGTRGLIVGGSQIEVYQENVNFSADSNPIQSVTVRYYRPPIVGD